MSEEERIKEFHDKIETARRKYRSDVDKFMERSRNHTMLDQGAREEAEIHRKFSAKLDALTEEYRDAVEAIRRKENPRSGSESGAK